MPVFLERVSSRGRIDGTSVPRSTRSTTPQTTLSITVGIRDDGTVYFHDTEGNPLPERAITAAKKQRGDVIRSLIEQKCDEINEQIGAVGYIHVYTPHPNVQPKHEIRDFESRPPAKPVPTTSGFFASLFKSRRDRIAKENALAEQQYALALRHWQAEKEDFEDEEGRRKAFIEHDIYTDLPAMEAFLEENLQAITWPRETTVSAAILELGRVVFIDIDLPEVEDMPNKNAVVPARGYKLSVKEMSAAQVQRPYMRHVHGIGFRVIGETFAALPNAQEVVLSGFSQRPDRTTGQITDEYLYSVRVKRASWSLIRFDNLENLDVVDSLSQFELREL